VEVKKDILWRVYLVYLFLCLFGLAVVFQVFRLQFVQGRHWKSLADSLTTDYKNIEAVRGNIYAADGSLLATSIPIFDIRMDLMAGGITNEIFNKSIDSLSMCLSAMFKDRSAKEYRRDLSQARREKERYHLIQKNVTYQQLKQIRKWPVFRLGKYKGGLIVLQRNIREKPFKLLASRTIGYDMDGNKPVGLEGSYSSYLKGVSGKRLMQRISGNIWVPINRDNEIDPKDGNDLITTLDVNIQDVAESALMKQLSMHNAHHGCAVLMEVSTGEVRAIANLERNAQGEYTESYNYAIGESTEPGSTFKLASLMAALEDRYVDLDDSVHVGNGTRRYYNATMRDVHAPPREKISVREAFEESSNVGISKIIYDSYIKKPQAFVEHLTRMRLDRQLGLEIPGEAKPMIKQPGAKGWSGTSLPWMSIGYEVQLTPLQILTFYNAVANNGRMVKPYFVKEIRHNGQLVKAFPPKVLKDSICTRITAGKARQLLESVVENGTAANLRNPDYRIAGKTGTAQVARGKGGYRDSSRVTYQASFVGYFPADNPKYSCIVVVNAPSNDVYYAAQVAGPIFKEIADKVYSSRLDIHRELELNASDSLHLPPYAFAGSLTDLRKVFTGLGYKPLVLNENAQWVSPSARKKSLALNERKVVEGIIPNVVGMGARDALYMLEDAGLHVRISGRGPVRKQSLPAGTRIIKGMEITLQLG
jgi:cell division protein FtsI (penicillin-binding protein 3)